MSNITEKESFQEFQRSAREMGILPEPISTKGTVPANAKAAADIVDKLRDATTHDKTRGSLGKECFTWSDHITYKAVKSKIKKGYTHRVEDKLRCPRCDKKGPNIEHGKTNQCQSCGLMMQVFGNALYAW